MAEGLSATEHKNLWFSNEAVKHRVETTSIIQKQFLPINSLDSLGTSLAIGGDNESIFLVENVLLWAAFISNMWRNSPNGKKEGVRGE